MSHGLAGGLQSMSTVTARAEGSVKCQCGAVRHSNDFAVISTYRDICSTVPLWSIGGYRCTAIYADISSHMSCTTFAACTPRATLTFGRMLHAFGPFHRFSPASMIVCPAAKPLVMTRISPSCHVKRSGRSTAAMAVGSCTYIESLPYESLSHQVDQQSVMCAVAVVGHICAQTRLANQSPNAAESATMCAAATEAHLWYCR